MLVNTKDILLKAKTGKYAVAAFNVYNLETAQAAIKVSEQLQHPVIIALGERYFDMVDVEGFASFVRTIGSKATIPVALHLDHAYEKESVIRAISAGFDSVMYDGSKFDLEENTRRTKEITEIAHLKGVSVEAEIGSVALGEFSDEEEGAGTLTDPKAAKQFVDETGIDFLAAAIGTVHGMYKGEPNIRLDLLDEIRQSVDIPLVLHGASGTPDDIIRDSVARGICKINVNTEVSLAATNFLYRLFQDSNEKNTHLSNVCSSMQKAMEPVMEKFIKLLMCK